MSDSMDEEYIRENVLHKVQNLCSQLKQANEDIEEHKKCKIRMKAQMDIIHQKLVNMEKKLYNAEENISRKRVINDIHLTEIANFRLSFERLCVKVKEIRNENTEITKSELDKLYKDIIKMKNNTASISSYMEPSIV